MVYLVCIWFTNILLRISLKKLFSLFIFGCAGYALLWGFSLLTDSGGFSLQWLLIAELGLQSTGSMVALVGLVAPRQVGSSWTRDGNSLAGRFFTTEPPGKSLVEIFCIYVIRDKGLQLSFLVMSSFKRKNFNILFLSLFCCSCPVASHGVLTFAAVYRIFS